MQPGTSGQTTLLVAGRALCVEGSSAATKARLLAGNLAVMNRALVCYAGIINTACTCERIRTTRDDVLYQPLPGVYYCAEDIQLFNALDVECRASRKVLPVIRGYGGLTSARDMHAWLQFSRSRLDAEMVLGANTAADCTISRRRCQTFVVSRQPRSGKPHVGDASFAS